LYAFLRADDRARHDADSGGNPLNTDRDDVTVTNDEAARRYEAHVDGRLALLQYRRSGDRLDLVHTEVPEELEGQGIGATLARFALEDARRRRWAVIPSCPFVASYIRRHPEYQDLVAADGSGF